MAKAKTSGQAAPQDSVRALGLKKADRLNTAMDPNIEKNVLGCLWQKINKGVHPLSHFFCASLGARQGRIMALGIL
ncbi:MAG: hypothetical protein HUK40_00490 [Desulfobacter sp.]|nr:hypothetical protein [Desulfobacter sp.]